MAYVYQEYPKSAYHADGRVVTVADAAALAALGAEWSTTPTVIARGVFRVTASTTLKVALAENLRRKGVKMTNDTTTANAKILYGSDVSSTKFTWPLPPGDRWEMPVVNGVPEYYGVITVIWDTADGGALQVQELEV